MANSVQRSLGRGLSVSAFGLGGGPLGSEAFDYRHAARLLHRALELGVRVIDTAPSYGASEERIGRAIRSASTQLRDELVVVTKGGYGIPGVPDWTPAVIEGGIDRAVSMLGTNRIAFLLHSCSLERLARGDLVAPLVRARDAGKIRTIGYAGDGDALDWAVRSKAFDVVECSVNVVDQRALETVVPNAASNGLAIIGKRGFASGVWANGGRDGPDSVYARRFVDAYRDVGFDLGWEEIAVRFACHAPGVATALFGTTSVERLERAIGYAARGPLPKIVTACLTRAYATRRSDWSGVV